ncbi:MAG: hypothetical protein H8D34_24830 [Chloroflexi bacterium]|nr:hypothetical protein [Chloroflexota bacterium]
MNKETAMPTQVVYQSYPDHEDEIDISELFNKIWLRRLFIVAFVFLVGVITAGLLSVQWLASPPEKRYSQILQFTFPAAEKGLYPGGQRFSYNDIVSAKVLDAVYKQNNLENLGVGFGDFANALTVSPFSTNEAFIKEKYKSLLADKKLTRPEIERMESVFLSELKSAQSRFVMLSFLESDLNGLDAVLINKVLVDIPRVWSQLAIEELGVLDLKVVGANFYQPDLVKRFEYLQTLEYLENSSRFLAIALKTLVDDEIGGFVRNLESGQSAVDLEIQLKNLVAFEIEPLFATVTNLGIAKDPAKALVYLQNTIQTLSDKKLVLVNKAVNIERIINQYADIKVNRSAEESNASAGGFAQYDSSFLDKFTALIEEKNDNAYRQGLLTQRLQVLQEIEEVEGQIIRFKRAEKILKESAEKVDEKTRSDVIKDINIALANFETLISGYQELLAVRNQLVLGKTEKLYQISSNELIVDSGLIDRLKKIIVYPILAGVIALMLAVVIALFRRLPEKAAKASAE